jgi:AmmeMemoRadiSam system protein B
VNPADKPCLRADLEILIAEADGERLLLVRDPEMLALDTTPFGIGVLPILQYLDGHHSLEQIRMEFVRQGAGFLQMEQLEGLVQVLDHGLLLDNESSRTEKRERDEFLASPVRPAAHAGAAYPEDAGPARRFLSEMLELAEERPAAPLKRLIAPHIDLQLGREVHAHAHRRLASARRPDVVVVLGVRHDFAPQRFIACRKDFATPLGTVRHDGALLDALEERLGRTLTDGQIAHRGEHSVEFQALWLAHHWPDDPPTLVPLLVGSFQDLIEARATPSSDAEVEAFVNALRDAIDTDEREVCVVASIDLAHVGPAYDDPEGLDEAGERRLKREDRAALAHVEAGDAEAFFRSVAADRNARHICGVAPVYITLRLGRGRGELLSYGQGRIHPESGSVVSYAAVSFAE